MTTSETASDQATPGGARAARPPRPRSAWSRFGSFGRELVFVVVGALIVSSLLRAFVGQMFSIPSESMENTLLVGDRVLVEKITDFDRGDIVVFADPADWIPYEEGLERGPVGQALEFVGVLPDTSTDHLIKRVIGMPGDRVKCCDRRNRMTVNDQPLDESSYLYTDAGGVPVAPSEVEFEVVVPANRIFVMGDHRDVSADSRCHLADNVYDYRGAAAFVPIDDVVGRAFAIAAPLSRITTLDRPDTFADVPPAAAAPPARAVIKPEGATC